MCVPLSLISLFISLDEKCFWNHKDMFYFKFQEFNPKWFIQVNIMHTELSSWHFWNSTPLNFIKKHCNINFPFVYCRQCVILEFDLHRQGTYIRNVILIVFNEKFLLKKFRKLKWRLVRTVGTFDIISMTNSHSKFISPKFYIMDSQVSSMFIY